MFKSVHEFMYFNENTVTLTCEKGSVLIFKKREKLLKQLSVFY